MPKVIIEVMAVRDPGLDYLIHAVPLTTEEGRGLQTTLCGESFVSWAVPAAVDHVTCADCQLELRVRR